MKKITPFIISILIALGTGGLSAFLSGNFRDTFENIAKPALSPPAFIFPIVWTILYILMGISAAMIYKSDAPEEQKKSALGIYLIQLLVNFFWSIWYFKFDAYLLAFIWLVFLIRFVIVMIYRFYKINKTAGLLQIPYLLWLIFAGYLNLMIFLLNR